MDDRSLRAAHAQVGVAPSLIRRLDEIPAIEAAADRDQLRQRRDPARVVSVEMTEDEVVDSLDSRLLRRRGDPLRVPVANLPARVEQQGVPRRRHDQGGGAALDVNPVDVEVSGLRSCHPRGHEQ